MPPPDVRSDFDFAIAIADHLSGIDPRELAESIFAEMGIESEEERFLVGAAVCHAYNRIVGGAACAAAAS